MSSRSEHSFPQWAVLPRECSHQHGDSLLICCVTHRCHSIHSSLAWNDNRDLDLDLDMDCEWAADLSIGMDGSELHSFSVGALDLVHLQAPIPGHNFNPTVLSLQPNYAKRQATMLL